MYKILAAFFVVAALIVGGMYALQQDGANAVRPRAGQATPATDPNLDFK